MVLHHLFTSMLAAAVTAAAAASVADPAYVREIESWRRERLQRLTADGGWLTVTGLVWLKPGANTFGADAANDVVLPARAGAACACR